MSGDNKTIAEVFPLDDIEGSTIEDVEFAAQDNSVVAFNVELDNGLVFKGKVTVRDLKKSDIDLPDGLMIDGIPVEEE